MRRVRVQVKIPRRVVTVTKSGRLYCNYCGRWNQAHVGLKNPACGNCGRPLA